MTQAVRGQADSTAAPLAYSLSAKRFPVAQEPTLWPMEWGPPGLFAVGRVAPDLDVSVAGVPGRWTVALVPR